MILEKGIYWATFDGYNNNLSYFIKLICYWLDNGDSADFC